MPPIDGNSSNPQPPVLPTSSPVSSKKIFSRVAYVAGGTVVLIFLLLGSLLWYREQPKVLADQFLCGGVVHAQLRAVPHGEAGVFYPFYLTYVENGKSTLIEELDGIKVEYTDGLLKNEGRSYWPVDVAVESTVIEVPNRDSSTPQFANIFVDPNTFSHEAYESIASCLKNEEGAINTMFTQGDELLKQTRLGGVTYSNFDDYFKKPAEKK